MKQKKRLQLFAWNIGFVVGVTCVWLVSPILAQIDVSTQRLKKESMTEEEAPLSKWGGSASYLLQTDLTERTKPAKYAHILSSAVSAQVLSWFRASIGADLSFYSLESSVPNEHGNPEVFDVFLSGSRRFDIMEHSALTAKVSFVFPTGETSRFEGQRGAVSGRLMLSSHLVGSWLMLSNDVHILHRVHRYSFSPTTGEASRKNTLVYRPGLAFQLVDGLFLSSGLIFEWSDRVDQEFEDIRTGNSHAISYARNNWLFRASFSNLTLANENRIAYFEQDPYSKIVSGMVSYDF